MAIIRTENIIAYWIDNKIVCAEHATDEEIEAVTQEDIILESQHNKKEVIFCDRGKERLSKFESPPRFF